MQLSIVRHRFLPEVTVGKLYVEGEFLTFTQEPEVRADRVFIPGESALPVGLYNVSLTHSRRFQRELPLLVSTRHGGAERREGRIGMRIHPGRPQIDEGCEIVLGQTEEPKFVSGTRLAFDVFFALLKGTIKRREAVDMEIAG